MSAIKDILIDSYETIENFLKSHKDDNFIEVANRYSDSAYDTLYHECDCDEAEMENWIADTAQDIFDWMSSQDMDADELTEDVLKAYFSENFWYIW